MSKLWKTFKLSELCQTGSGGTPSRKENKYYEGGNIPWIKSGELRNDEITETSEFITQEGINNSAAKLLEPGCVLIAMYGATTGQCAMLRIPAATNQAICHIFPNEELGERFLYYFLKSQYQQLLRLQVGGAQPNISQTILKNLEIPVPHPKEQARIVELLDQADALRKLRSQADEKAARILPALFHHYFGDPSRYKSKRPLGELAADGPQYGANASAVNFDPELPRYIRITDVNSVGQLIESKKSSVQLPLESPYLLKQNDILFARSGATVGKTYIHKDVSKPAIYAGYFIRFRVDENLILPDYLFAVTQSEYYRLWVKGKQRAAAQPNINGREYSELMVPVPPVSEQKKFVRNMHLLNGVIESTTTSKQKLEDLFQLLLHRAFTGELTAKWREDHMSELVEEMEIQAKA